MASKVSIAIRREAALGRLHNASRRLAAQFGIQPVETTRQVSDPALQEAIRLEQVAIWLETLAERAGEAEAKPASARRKA